MTENEILAVKGGRVDKTFSVVWNDGEAAVAALTWKTKHIPPRIVPCLGVRSFEENFPANSWLIVPRELSKILVEGLPFSRDFRKQIEGFLHGDILGKDLPTHDKWAGEISA